LSFKRATAKCSPAKHFCSKMVLAEISPNVRVESTPSKKAFVSMAEAAAVQPPPPTPTPLDAPVIAPPAVQVSDSEADMAEHGVLEHLSRHPKLARILFAGGQGAFLALMQLNSSVASLSAWAALGAVVAASVASIASPRPGAPPQLTEFDVAPAVSRVVDGLNTAFLLLHRIRAGDAKLGLKAGLSVWAAAIALHRFSLLFLAWLAFTVSAGLPLIPQRQQRVEALRQRVFALASQLMAVGATKLNKAAAEMPNAKYALAAAALIVWYRLSWIDMGLAAVFGALGAKVRYFDGNDAAELNKQFESAVAGAQKKARRMTLSARALFSPSKATNKME
jgi:hypothetical protein